MLSMSTRCVGRSGSGVRSAAALPLKSPSTSEPHRFGGIARTAGAAETEVELQTFWHKSKTVPRPRFSEHYHAI